MFRVLFLTFYGNFRGTHDQEHHLHESPRVMTTPLIILAVLSTVGGFLGMPGIISEKNTFEEFLKPITSFPQAWEMKEPSHFFEWTVVIVSLVVLTLCILYTYKRYAIKQSLVSDNESEQKPIVRSAYRKFYVDEIYDSLIVKPLVSISKIVYNFFDLKIIDGVVNSVSKILVSTSGVIRYGQSGYVGFYIFMMVCGIIAILLFNLVIK
jgi:NADH-quinone oxidoreductase subunit L